MEQNFVKFLQKKQLDQIIENQQVLKSSYLNAIIVRSIFQIQTIEVVYFIEVNNTTKFMQFDIIAPVGENEMFWIKETDKRFKICNIQDYDQNLQNYQLRGLAQKQGYQSLQKSHNYYGYFYRFYNKPVSGCLHQISGCRYYCEYCKDFHVCSQCSEHNIHKNGIIQCLFCDYEQQFASQCSHCKKFFGNYSCKICMINIHTTDFTHPYSHCKNCNVCHPNNYIYCQLCKKCNNDILHDCQQQQQCPVCFDLLNNDQIQSECGHNICYKCYRTKNSENDIKCPICRKTFLLDHDLIYFKDLFGKIFRQQQQFQTKILKNKCNDCGKIIYQNESEYQYCKNCQFYNVEKMYYIEEGMQEGYLFEPTLKSMKEFLLDNYTDEICYKFNIKKQNERKIISEIYKFLGINADDQTASKMMKIAVVGMNLEQLKVNMKKR